MGKYKQLDVNLFKNPSNTTSYILGFIASDGCIHKDKNGSESMSIFLQKEDRNILEKIKKNLNVDNKIYIRSIKKGGDQAQLRLTCKGLIAALKPFGIGPNKTKGLAWPKNLSDKQLIHFVRGYFDGDGRIRLKKTRTGVTCTSIEFCCSSKSFAESLTLFLNKLGFQVKAYSYIFHTLRIYYIRLNTPSIAINSFYKLFYPKSKKLIYLDRKHNSLLLALKNPTKRIIIYSKVTNRKYKNITQASRELGLTPATVRSHLRIKRLNKFKLKKLKLT